MKSIFPPTLIKRFSGQYQNKKKQKGNKTMAILTTMRINISFDEENLLKILHNFCETLQTKDFEIKNSVIENTFSEYFRFNNFNEFKDALRKSIADIMVRKSNDTFAFYNSDRETGAYTAIIKLHTKTDVSVSKELLSILNNAILEAYPSTKPKNDLMIDVLVAEYDTERNTLISYEEIQIFKPDESLSDIKAQLTNPTVLTTRNIEPSVNELLDEGVYQEGKIISAKWLCKLFERGDIDYLNIINRTGYYPNEGEVNEIFDILDVEAKLSYENLYEGFEEMMCNSKPGEMMCDSKPGKELLLRILTRTLEDATRRLKSITQEKE